MAVLITNFKIRDIRAEGGAFSHRLIGLDGDRVIYIREGYPAALSLHAMGLSDQARAAGDPAAASLWRTASRAANYLATQAAKE